MALNNAISRLLDAGTINLSAEIQAVRDQRPVGFGTPSQWVFAHRALIQFALDHNLLITDFNLDELHGDDEADINYTNNVLLPTVMAAHENALTHVAQI